MNDDESAIHHYNLREVLRVLRRRLRVFLLAFLLVPAGALAFSLLQTPQYTASASLLFRDPGLDAKLFESPVLEPSTDPDRQAETNLRLVSLDVVADRTARRLGGRTARRLRGLSRDDVSDRVETRAEPRADIVAIEATDRDPAFAARLANTFAKEYVAFRREADRANVREAQEVVERQRRLLPKLSSDEDDTGRESEASAAKKVRARSLEDRAQELKVLAALQTGNAELVQEADVPDEPSSPQPVRNTAIGAVLGLLLGIALVFLRERLDRRLKDPEEAEAIFARPVLGFIAESPALSADADGRPNSLPPREAEAFRMLRANLRYFNVTREIHSLVVTSAAPGDGKSTVAWNLAATAAEVRSRILLVEADLRHPSLAERHGLRTFGGLSSVLAGDAAIEDARVRITLAKGGNNGGGPSFDLLLAGPLPPNPTDLIESERMAEVIRSAEHSYDMVVLDTPPTSLVSDAIPLVTQVSGVIVVSRIGRTTQDAARSLHRQLEHLGAPTLGVVVNGMSKKSDSYGYGYGYGREYYGTEAGRLETGPAVGAQSSAAADRF